MSIMVRSVRKSSVRMNRNSLRSVRIHYSDGSKTETNMSKDLKDSEIRQYYKRGRIFNVGSGQNDRLVRVKNVEILE